MRDGGLRAGDHRAHRVEVRHGGSAGGGRTDGKGVVDDQTAIKRIKAAVDARRDENLLIMARTDIRAAEAKVSFNDLVIKACAKALRGFPTGDENAAAGGLHAAQAAAQVHRLAGDHRGGHDHVEQHVVELREQALMDALRGGRAA